MLKKEFGAAGEAVVIEEFLEGEELSFFTFSDGLTPANTSASASTCFRRLIASFVLFPKSRDII